MIFADVARRTLGLDLTGVRRDRTLTELGVTSKQLVILLLRIEDELGQQIPFEAIAGLGTIESFETYIAKVGRES